MENAARSGPRMGDQAAESDISADGHASSRRSDVDPALVVDSVSKRYGSGADGILAVDDVSFSVDRGAIVGLLGPNGAGKTTLIKSVLGMVIPDEGSVTVFGTDATNGRRAAYADVDAMLEGARNDYWRLTVRENLRYFATISGVDPDSVQSRHDRLLDRLGLADRADTPVRDLSRGMKQKVSLASVLAGGAELVFLDEPTLGLDVESARTLRTELKRLAREEGLTILVSSHDMRTIEDVCDRVIVMSEGRIVADGPVEELLAGPGGDAVRVTSTDIDDRLLDDIRERFEVRSVERRGDRVTVEVRATGQELYPLVDLLRESGVTIEGIHTVEPDLEDVFLRLTDGQSPQSDEQRATQGPHHD